MEFSIRKLVFSNISFLSSIGDIQAPGGLSPLVLKIQNLGEGNGNPLQCSCLENPRDGGACWAAVSGVAQSQIQPKRLRSSSSIGILILLCFALLHFLDIVLFIN